MKTFIAQTTRKYTPENWLKHYKGLEINSISKALQISLSQNRNYIYKTPYNTMNQTHETSATNRLREKSYEDSTKPQTTNSWKSFYKDL
jgi:hypothetical protein